MTPSKEEVKARIREDANLTFPMPEDREAVAEIDIATIGALRLGYIVAATQYEAELSSLREKIVEVAGQTDGQIKPKGKKGRKRAVEQLSLSGEFVALFESCPQAAWATDINLSKIKLCVAGRQKSADGYIFKHKDSPLSHEAEVAGLYSTIHELRNQLAGARGSMRSFESLYEEKSKEVRDLKSKINSSSPK